MTKVLIADDIASNLYLLESILKGNGFEVISAKNGAEALAMAKKAPPDLIITDILMPVMDGFELCRQWKADVRLQRIPLIFYTATYTDARDEQFAKNLGADRFIVKPTKPEVLVQEIRTVLEESQTGTRNTVAGTRGDEKEILQEYNEVLFRKLEKKVMQLEAQIAERKAAQEQREVVIRELEQKNAELARFTHTVSHELRSPLITIQGFSGLIEEDVSTMGGSEELRNHVRRISAAVDTMDALLADLLRLSRAGQTIDLPEKTGFGIIAREAAALLAQPLENHGVQLEIAPDLPEVNVDHARIREVLINLIENAIRFRGDRKNPVIRIGVDETGNIPVFFVQDNGIGIEPRYLERIFNLFEKLDGTTQGTGVGLAIVKRIIEAHGGTIRAESEGPGKGTTIRFTLPPPTGGLHR
jgi:signal transduction histidine kinase